ncbi:hypothetical protein ABIC65_001040 [Sphingomonas trueperi]|uniref:hypothetical protein n=1 Tax=Sphingomonas trueperi TaxID=53317 RepID=UPI00339671DA
MIKPPSTLEAALIVIATLEDLLETAVSERDKTRDESTKADDETRALKLEMLRMRALGASADYALVMEFKRRAERAEAALAAFREQSNG